MALSYSQWSLYEQCPRKWQFKYKLGLEIPQHPAATRGVEIHKACEEFLCHRTEYLPPISEYWQKQIHSLRLHDALSEQKLALTEAMEPCDFDAPEAYLRGIIDANELLPTHELFLIDFKTGAIRWNHIDQLGFYAVLKHPGYAMDWMHGAAWYVDQGETHKETSWDRADRERLSRIWHKRARVLLTDTECRPSPGTQCGWCPFCHLNGGTCDAYQPTR